ncbi:hypothetical protein JCM31826_06080 [Thermaurantimonas aggregans]|uniref:Nudix hydrolase domain-containing protein n=1 Tax=Thermaurantimonas aggregans TaxID=2173829 RepID=A0A401XJE2_9FLAO|nr:hypothetical protein JCM31826_06080 [Thermaurantimonas aggregans]
MYKVNIQNSLLAIGGKPIRRPDWLIDYYNFFPFDTIINQLENSPVTLYYHIKADSNEEEVWKEFTKYFEIIHAAGGVVKNKDGKFLIIKRHGKFDLPKGKVEEYENLRDAALREVAEECGIKNCTLDTEEPTISYHTYSIDGKRVLKKTHWFPMTVDNSLDLFKPQTEEGITDVFWLEPEKLNTIFSNTYPNIKDLLIHFSKKK